MKRVITYLHEYVKGKRGKNVGFVKADIHKEETQFAVFLQNFVQQSEMGKVYLLVKENELAGICVGNLYLKDGQGDIKQKITNKNVMGSNFSIQDVVGVAICFDNTEYLASCWNESYEENVALGEFREWENIQNVEVTKERECLPREKEIQFIEEMEAATIAQYDDCLKKEQTVHMEREEEPCDKVTYQKIELGDIRSLPSPNWHFCNNSFLVHGFWNYGYLVIKKETAKNEEELFLGVPGIFEKPEMVMAVVFGFTDFEATPPEIVKWDMGKVSMAFEKQKKQQPKTGEFGCWFVKLNK